jgi:S1-C subfamily serine protease
MKPVLLLSLGTLFFFPPQAGRAGPGDAVVKVLASVQYPNPLQPWTKGRPLEVAGTGVVIEGDRILTNAHVVLYATEVYVQARPGDEKLEAKVEAVGPDVDLAVLKVEDPKFFGNRPPLERAKKLPAFLDQVEVYGFPVGGNGLAVTKGNVARIEYGLSGATGLDSLIQVSAAINPGNSGGPAVVNNQMVGLVFSRLGEAENVGYLIPNEEIDLFLEDCKDGRYDGKPREAAGTRFQRLENDALRGLLRLDKQSKGVLVIPPCRAGADYPFQEFDVLTKVGDHDLNNEGMVQLPDGQRVPFYCLIPKLARDNAVPVSVVRQGRCIEVSWPLSKADARLIRAYQGEPPSYFIHGPLVFSPAREDAVYVYARVNPALDLTTSPQLTRRYDRARFPGEELVVVTAPMFKHKTARGYRDPVGQVVREVNGVAVQNLRHLVELLRDSTDEYLTFRFAEEAAELLVFRRQEIEQVTQEILQENGIPPARRGSADMLQVWKKDPAPPR